MRGERLLRWVGARHTRRHRRRAADRSTRLLLQVLFDAIESALPQPTEAFLETVDRAKRQFAERLTDPKERVRALLFAAKAANILVARHEYLHQRINVIARPAGFMVDPANGCQLGCPTCANTYNRDFAAATFNPWPKAILGADLYDTLLDEVGVTAFNGHFYNKSEPFLNRRTPHYVRRAHELQVKTSISTNFSFGKLDVDAIVESGLDELVVAIDGATQDVYSVYRRGGHIDLVYENIRRLVEAKRRRRVSHPWIRWHYLTFEHNIHQIDMATAIARDLGVDLFFATTPIDVSAEEPGIAVAVYKGRNRFVVFRPYEPSFCDADPTPMAAAVERRFGESVVERFHQLARPFAPEEAAPERDDHCDWLYLGTIMEAAGRLVPCCMGDNKGAGRFVIGHVEQDRANLLNSPGYREARTFVNNPARHAVVTADRPPSEVVRCKTCRGRPYPQIGLDAVQGYVGDMWRGPTAGWVSEDTAARLGGWSRHAIEPVDASSPRVPAAPRRVSAGPAVGTLARLRNTWKSLKG